MSDVECLEVGSQFKLGENTETAEMVEGLKGNQRTDSPLRRCQLLLRCFESHRKDFQSEIW